MAKSASDRRAKQETGKEEKKTLYELLRVSPSASQSEITKAYRNLALLLHPDKVVHRLEQQAEATSKGEGKAADLEELKSEATRHFQELQAAYEVLKDPKRRKRYDETGSTGDDAAESFEEAYEYYRRVFPEFNSADIDSYRQVYLESAEEVQDILDFCHRFDGDLTHFFEYIPFSDKEHLPRYLRILRDLVDTKKVKKNATFVETLKQLETQAEKYAALVEKESKQLTKKNAKKKDDKMESLILAIQSNRLKRAQNARDLFARLEAKYQNADEEGAARNATDKRENKKRRRKN
ncbi:DnaJ domain-containing protein [Toxoplasma gondii TgCatPRC2]|uniref:DnaJ domain-containing protein n=4 Tax=Toxoplasma gondii TaxID=5811 RepID=B6K9M3_TOXGV|nr:DnaJ domain-containing protein [Toxoplasma gondii ME49]ESS35325.1 DnaJ domain-containing protein [Toxoplasma gondii VEG]KFG36725.1 DnaJ domain-containing protein [Toxoplasma gondii GAB2-2007-GAL-DOM2]KYK65671.1 DnaJ domain-containing protein [Toxoplasma gondii TgCatPRC2]EPT25716.1 DnaJ domain-containing protein [Toxoplasma gondii ME49]CEL77769.1 TPA: DnaJ domain-containing protein [Toxoplasma gondii VEG]|eukprot:XP_002364747.1 DnaJ domain-containing protein [Toxoplasma gondii ME49]